MPATPNPPKGADQVPRLVEVPVEPRAHALFLENRLRELYGARESVSGRAATLARIDAEIEVINRALSRFRATGKFETVIERMPPTNAD